MKEKKSISYYDYIQFDFRYLYVLNSRAILIKFDLFIDVLTFEKLTFLILLKRICQF